MLEFTGANSECDIGFCKNELYLLVGVSPVIRDKTGCTAASLRVTRDTRVLKSGNELAISAIFPDGAAVEPLPRIPDTSLLSFFATTSVHRAVKKIESETFILSTFVSSQIQGFSILLLINL
jgi:hypothetical protein